MVVGHEADRRPTRGLPRRAWPHRKAWSGRPTGQRRTECRNIRFRQPCQSTEGHVRDHGDNEEQGTAPQSEHEGFTPSCPTTVTAGHLVQRAMATGRKKPGVNPPRWRREGRFSTGKLTEKINPSLSPF